MKSSCGSSKVIIGEFMKPNRSADEIWRHQHTKDTLFSSRKEVYSSSVSHCTKILGLIHCIAAVSDPDMICFLLQTESSFKFLIILYILVFCKLIFLHNCSNIFFYPKQVAFNSAYVWYMKQSYNLMKFHILLYVHIAHNHNNFLRKTTTTSQT